MTTARRNSNQIGRTGEAAEAYREFISGDPMDDQRVNEAEDKM